MAKSFPPDRFDRIPGGLERVGAHRAPARPGRGWITFAWAALATGVLVLASVVGLTVFADSIDFDSPFSASSSSPSPSVSEPIEQTAAPVLDASIEITVLNGTTTNGLANDVGDLLVSRGWCGAAETTVSDGPCAGSEGEGSRVTATENDIPETVVYYNDPSDEGAARAIVDELAVGGVRLSGDYSSSPIAVVLGADYAATTAP